MSKRAIRIEQRRICRDDRGKLDSRCAWPGGANDQEPRLPPCRNDLLILIRSAPPANTAPTVGSIVMDSRCLRDRVPYLEHADAFRRPEVDERRVGLPPGGRRQ